MRTIDRIYEVVTKSGVPERKVASTLAKLCGVSAQAVHAWRRGEILDISAEYIAIIAKRYRSTSDYLIAGRMNEVRESNINQYVVSAGDVPLISWVRAGSWDEPIDNTPGDAEMWLPCPSNCRKETTFALTVKGPSMDDGTARGYRDGELIFVDASQTNPEHNADVIVRNGDGEVTFKRLINSDGKWYLKPLNQNWPEPIIHFSENCHLIGRVMFSGQTRN